MKPKEIDPIATFLNDPGGISMIKDMILQKSNRYNEVQKKREEFFKSDVYPDVQGEIRPYFLAKVFDMLLEGKEIPEIERDLSNMCYILRKAQNKIPKQTEWAKNYEHATERVRIGDVVSHFMKNQGFRRNLKCPFHQDRTASLKVYEKSNQFICFGCGARGTPIDFVMQYKNCDFKEAVNFLAQF